MRRKVHATMGDTVTMPFVARAPVAALFMLIGLVACVAAFWSVGLAWTVFGLVAAFLFLGAISTRPVPVINPIPDLSALAHETFRKHFYVYTRPGASYTFVACAVWMPYIGIILGVITVYRDTWWWAAASILNLLAMSYVHRVFFPLHYAVDEPHRQAHRDVMTYCVRRTKAHWHGLRAEVMVCEHRIETLLGETVKLPEWRLPAIERSLPAIIEEGVLNNDQEMMLSRLATLTQEINRGLDEAAIHSGSGNQTQFEMTHRRYIGIAKRLLNGAPGEIPLIPEALRILDEHLGPTFTGGLRT